jgi:hypothetical protein
MVEKKNPTVSAKKQTSLFTFDVGVGENAKRVCIRLAHVSEIVWDAGNTAKLVMASGQSYDLSEVEAAAITRRLERSK